MVNVTFDLKTYAFRDIDMTTANKENTTCREIEIHPSQDVMNNRKTYASRDILYFILRINTVLAKLVGIFFKSKIFLQKG